LGKQWENKVSHFLPKSRVFRCFSGKQWESRGVLIRGFIGIINSHGDSNYLVISKTSDIKNSQNIILPYS